MGTILGFFARSALMTSPIGSFLKMIPRWVWIALAGALALGLLIHIHQVKVRAYGKAQHDAGYAQAMKDIEAKAIKIKQAADALNAKVSQLERSKSDAEISRIDRAADALSVRGPGAARCVGVIHPGVASSPGGHGAAPAQADPAPAGVPAADGAADLAAVSWKWLVATGGQCDAAVAENKTWRSWWEAIAKSWPGK